MSGRPHHSIIIIAICAALSGLLFGYDAGIISGALLFINKSFVISSLMQGWLVAMVPLGALLASIISGNISDVIGRKKTLFLTAILFIIGSLGCAISTKVSFLMLNRLILGAAIGIGSSIAPVYTAELSKETERGWLVNLFVVFIQIGVLLSFIIGYLLSDSGMWREMIGVGVFPALLLMAAIFYLPESPRWLVTKKRITEAKLILTNIYGSNIAEQQLKEIQQIAQLHTLNWRILFKDFKYLRVILSGGR